MLYLVKIPKIQNYYYICIMRYTIKDKDLLELLTTGKNGKFKSVAKNPAFMTGLRRVFATFDSAPDVAFLHKVSFLHYERLTGNMSGLSSCRIINSSPLRLIIEEYEGEVFISILRMEDYHNG